MCGFAGFLSFEPETNRLDERRRLLLAMGDAIAHRGPDDAQYYDDGYLALVFRRLSIVDVQGGSQPIHSEDGNLLIAANGEIYNHRELRRELASNHQFRSDSDCEIPLHAFEEWGDSSWQRLDGMFAMVLWDRQAKILQLVRDRLGIKPLYVCCLSTGILFGSELKALLVHPQCPRDLNWTAFGRASHTRAETTTYLKGVEMLPGGHVMRVTLGGEIQRRSYWKIEDHLAAAPFGVNATKYKDRYSDLLEQVTYRHLQRDVDAGLHLSGGLDSSLIAGIVSRKEKNFPCFSVVERITCVGGDVDSARRLTKSLGLPWYPVRFDYRTLLDEMAFDLRRFEQMVWMMDSPRFNLEWLFKGELHRTARAQFPNLKVVLLGQGADEFAGGYSHRLDGPHASWNHYIQDEIAPFVQFDSVNNRAAPLELHELMNYKDATDVDASVQYSRMVSLWARQLQNYNLWHEDRSSSWNSLEARVPFLDHHLVELLVSVPHELRESLFWKKEIIREAARRFLPMHVFEQSKLGFLDSNDLSSVNLINHGIIKRSIDEFREKYVESSSPLFDREKINRLIQSVVEGSPSNIQNTQRLLDCMAAAIFQRHCQEAHRPFNETDRDASPMLSIVQPDEWESLTLAMQAVPQAAADWMLTDRVALPEQAEVHAPLSNGNTQRYSIMVEDSLVSRIEVPLNEPWLRKFLKNLGSPATVHFTLQDWIDEFDLDQNEFFAAMTVLHRGGAIVRRSESIMRTSTARIQGVSADSGLTMEQNI